MLSQSGAKTAADHPTLWVVSRCLLAGLGAALSVLAFPPYGAPAAVILGLAFLIYAISHQRSAWGALYGALYGLTFSSLSAVWLANRGIAFWLAAVLVCVVLYAMIGAAAARLSTLTAAPLWIASVFGVVDALTGIVDVYGVDTTRLSYSQYSTVLFDLAWLGGAPLIAFIIALLASLLARLIFLAIHELNQPLHVLATALAFSLVVVGFVGISGLGVGGSNEEEIEILAIQPARGQDLASLGRPERDQPRSLSASLEWVYSYASQYEYGRTAPADLVVLPPGTLSPGQLDRRDIVDSLTLAAGTAQSPLLVGEPSADGTATRYVLWTNSGMDQEVVVSPQGEPRNGPVTESNNEQVGSPLGLIEVGEATIGVIESPQAFESPDEMQGLAAVDALVILRPQPANRQIDDGAATHQLTASRLFAGSIGRGAAIVSAQGPSALLYSDGSIISWADLGRAGFLADRVPLNLSGSLPERRDTFLLLAFLLLPIGAFVLSLYAEAGLFKRKRPLSLTPPSHRQAAPRV